MSFHGLVQAVINARQANPHLVQKFGWSLDYDTVANEIDSYNAAVAESMGWTEFFTSGEPQGHPRSFHQPPSSFPSSPLQVAAGAKPVIEWLASGAEAVKPEQATARALVCSKCPLNGKGDWTRFFTVPVTEAIRGALSQRSQWKLETEYDSVLGTCDACTCPLRLKVHMPIDRIWPKMKPEIRDSLHQDCWIRKESLPTT